ncbi:MAG: hypothetical protein H7840_03430 [Alphaproteobacteria bacterium]
MKRGNSVMGRLRRLATVTLGVAVAAGCVSDRERETPVSATVAASYLADKPVALRPHLVVRQQQGVRNLVLNDMRIGLAALELGETRLAADLFDEALLGIEAVYADTPSAAEARSLWAKEAVKDFKGEPYERAMAYYYRGLLYLWVGDYQNARASFKSGVLQDAFAEEEQHRADFALLIFLEGWASHCDGRESLAEESYAEVKTLRPGFVPPGRDDDTLILAETGWAPVKSRGDQRAGLSRRHLMFFPGGNPEKARVRIPAEPLPPVAAATAAPATIDYAPRPAAKPDGWFKPRTKPSRSPSIAAAESLPAPPPPTPSPAESSAKPREESIRDTLALEDIQFQATTRGGRPVDAILDGKAQFRDVAGVTGDILLNSGMVLAGSGGHGGGHGRREGDDDRATTYAAVGMMVAGLVAKSIEAAVEAGADTRYWDNLPGKVYGITLALPPTVTTLPVEFLNDSGRPIGTKGKQAALGGSGRCRLGWVRANPAFPVPPRGPNSAPAEIMASPVIVPPVPDAAPTPPRRTE